MAAMKKMPAKKAAVPVKKVAKKAAAKKLPPFLTAKGGAAGKTTGKGSPGSDGSKAY